MDVAPSYLNPELRLIALAGALKIVPPFLLSNHAERFFAYRAAGLGPVMPAEDAEALRRAGQRLTFFPSRIGAAA